MTLQSAYSMSIRNLKGHIDLNFIQEMSVVKLILFKRICVLRILDWWTMQASLHLIE